MVESAFPLWAGLALHPLGSSGTDHLLFRLGSDMVVRIPGNGGVARHVAYQAVWLERFDGLSLQVPRVLGVGEPNEDCPYHWSVLTWIDGEDAAVAQVTDWGAAAVALGRFVAQLRTFETAGGLPSDRGNALRGAPLRRLDGWMRGAIGALAGTYESQALLAHWEEALAVPEWREPPVWVHGELHPGNIILCAGHITGVIDFGLASLGDPACDLAPAWTFLPAAQRQAFRELAGLDSAAWRRGKGWGLYCGVIALAHHGERNPVLARMAERAIAAVLDS